VKEEVFEDAVDQDVVENTEESSYDTNQDDLYYFARLTNHNLHLAKTSTYLAVHSRHTMKYPIIADSGANFHMFREREFFVSLTPADGYVILWDGKSKLSIRGIGTVTCQIGDNILVVKDVWYILDLAESIYSLFLHF
jgi:hypothetical protein